MWGRRASRPARVETIDLLHGLDSAQKRASMAVDQAFHVEFVTIDGDRRQAIFAHPASRLTWPLRLPGRAVLRTAIALKPEVWERANDGVLFRIGISDGRYYEQLYYRHLHPAARAEDRRWTPVEIDLRAFTTFRWSLFYRPWDRTWNLILSTDNGPERTSTPDWDWSLWAAPTIFGTPR